MLRRSRTHCGASPPTLISAAVSPAAGVPSTRSARAKTCWASVGADSSSGSYTDPVELVRLTVAGSQAEAQMICALLKTAGIEALQRQTDAAAGARDGFPVGGASDVLVSADDLER